MGFYISASPDRMHPMCALFSAPLLSWPLADPQSMGTGSLELELANRDAHMPICGTRRIGTRMLPQQSPQVPLEPAGLVTFVIEHWKCPF